MATGAPAHAEVIPDTDTGSGDSAEVNDKGLTTEEQAQFDEMMRGEAGDAGPGTGETPLGDGAAGDGAAAGEEGDEDEGDEDAGEAGEGVGEADPPAAASGKEPGAKEPGGEKKHVSYSKHRRELTKREKATADLTQQLETERANRIKLGERLAILNEALTASTPAAAADAPKNPLEEADLDPNEDVWKALDQSNRRIKYLAENLGGMQQQSAEQRADTDLKSNYIRDAQAFTSQAPDYQDAYNFMKDVRLVEIAIGEFDKDPTDPDATFTKPELDRIVQFFNEEERALAEDNFRKGRSPAATIYKIAKKRGYAPKAAAASPPPPPAAPGKNGNGTSVPAVRTAPVVSEVQRLRKATENGKSLSDGGSTSDITSLTPDRLIAMSEEEFGDLVDRLPPRQLAELMGRDASQ